MGDAQETPNGRLADCAVITQPAVGANSAQRIGQLLKFTATIDPASVAAGATSEQTFTVAGVQVGDLIFEVIKPTHTVGVVVAGARVPAANQVAVALANPTIGAVDAPAETWTFMVARP